MDSDLRLPGFVQWTRKAWPCKFLLQFLYQRNLARALRILDMEGVKRITGQNSKRSIFVVRGETDKSDQHLCLLKPHFCSCPSFFFDVVVRHQHLCCKHQLAASLAEALRICKDQTVSDQELAILLLEKRSKRNRRQVHYALQEK
ncbi:zinc finger SWIM domain-containing protein 7-like isoform X2 [Selaginella moellendorffii]|uniref:zinc finger SWIM domain-containing protein 7 isoform X2 n=1 Tax=Selaginella moellendorffii TaxID=88036 RepID=UPI000D1CEBE6|nr:zinc finger SWIM domain-containing protein 7 isoform X2 [Selaginella moellendorffii]XP_024533596.1 zinc finger SWIM domain-containing protein 7-like isoform X2 [Selaginella moellendorffii]|eukprot:XP_002988124.2 zinc finger SWIM domain-containing protein 7 isoform X2 [Selaginella moellendorffii]